MSARATLSVTVDFSLRSLSIVLLSSGGPPFFFEIYPIHVGWVGWDRFPLSSRPAAAAATFFGFWSVRIGSEEGKNYY